MAYVKLIVNNEVFTFSNGDVKSVRSIITGKPTQQEISASGPMSAYLYDYDGVLKKISVSGILTNADSTRVAGSYINTIYEQKQWLESLLNGDQDLIEFESTYDSQTVLSKSSPTNPYQAGFTSTYCMIESMEFNEVDGEPNHLRFNITLIVGSS